MGWWSTTILGGDEALDALDTIERTLGVDDLYPLRAITAEQREAVTVALADPATYENIAAAARSYTPSGPQVLGALLLAVGAAITDQVKADIHAAIDAEDLDEWGASAQERSTHLETLRAAVDNHTPGHRTDIDDKGLFEALANVIGG